LKYGPKTRKARPAGCALGVSYSYIQYIKLGGVNRKEHWIYFVLRMSGLGEMEGVWGLDRILHREGVAAARPRSRERRIFLPCYRGERVISCPQGLIGGLRMISPKDKVNCVFPWFETIKRLKMPHKRNFETARTKKFRATALCQADERTISHIEEFGSSVVKVARTNQGFGWSYTIGIFDTSGGPEIITVGLPPET